MKLLYESPSIDQDETSFVQSYRLAIDAIKEQTKVVYLLVQRVTHAEEDQCKLFHDKFARFLNIPLTLQAYLYGDLQKKGTTSKGPKLVRNNSSYSRLSRDRNS